MPIFDWTRTEMFHPLPDGSTSLFFDKEKITSINPQELVEMVEKESRGLTLPGWEPERLAKIKELFVAYEGFTDDKLRENFHYFIEFAGDKTHYFNGGMIARRHTVRM